MVRKLVLAVAAASALMSSNMVQALGVGEINLRSALNQPLEAEIELLQIRDLSSTEIRSVLASPDDFGRAGVDRSFFLTDLTFTPVVQPNGKAYIRVTSTRPVREPYLNFLMEVRWPSGKVLREFTLLLDPPLYDPTPSTLSTPIAQLSTPPSGTVRPPVSAPAPASTAAASSAPRAAPTATPAGAAQRRTTRDDTLWGIALEVRPHGSSVHQTMLAIQDLNPQAFIGNNINTLKAGQTLTLPTAEQAAVRSQSEAIAEVSGQTSAWQDRRSASAPAQRQLDARERSVAADAPAQTAGEDSLRLVASSDDSGDDSVSSSGGQNGTLRDSLDQTKEQLDSAERARTDLSERLADVEGQLDTLQRLLTLKDAQLAALQRELANEGGLPDILPDPEAAAAADADDAALADAQAETVDSETDQSAGAELDLAALDALAEAESEPEASDDAGQEATETDEELLAVTAAASPASQADSGPDASTPDAAPQSPAAPEAQPDNSPEALLQQFMQNQTLLLGTGAVALLALLLVLMGIARRNARREAELTENYLAESAAQRDAAAAEEGEDFNVALADTETGVDEPVALDPLTEADELISYGELDNAADILEAAIEQQPERADLRLKMMEVEARRENLQGYAAQQEALKAMGVAGSAVEMMGARYPLMAAGLMSAGALLDSHEDDQPLFEDSLVQPELDEPESGDAAMTGSDADDFDFADFGLEEDTAASLADAADQEAGFDLDFDLDEDSSAGIASLTQESAELPAAPPAEEAPAAAQEDDFDLNLGDELQADSLLAELEAMSLSDAAAPQPEVDALDAGEDDSFSLSDEDLAGFEAQLQSVMQGEPQTGATDQLDDFNNLGAASEDLMSDGLDEDFDFLTDTDECATKLDLARAYIDMGDEEGARDILAEVVDEGNEQQQQDARELMGQLG